MTGELLLYALVAGGLVFWLRSILGTRHGEERDQSEGIMSALSGEDNSIENAMAGDAETALNSEEQIRDLLNKKEGTISIESKAAETGVLDIAKQDKAFEIKFFLEAVQDVFVMVVEGFGKGDRELLQDLLVDDVYKAFDGAIAEREKSGETLSNEIHAINRAEIIEAELDGKDAKVTVRFIADEISVTRDENEEIIAGHPERTTEMRDIWVFSRSLKSRDPRWFVIETRGDFDGDNETIPNSK